MTVAFLFRLTQQIDSCERILPGAQISSKTLSNSCREIRGSTPLSCTTHCYQNSPVLKLGIVVQIADSYGNFYEAQRINPGRPVKVHARALQKNSKRMPSSLRP